MQKLTRNDLNMIISAMEHRAEQLFYEHVKNAESTESAEYQIATISVERLENLIDKLYTTLENNDKRIEIK